MPDLCLQSFSLGQWMTNCYVLNQQGSRSCWIIDAGFDPQPLIDAVKDHGLTPQKIVLTHAHLDHIAGLEEVHAYWPEVPILIHEAEQDFLTDTALNLSLYAGIPLVAPQATGVLKHGQRLMLDGLSFEVRHTPGHSPGGVAFICQQAQTAVVGDTLFAGSIGRYDFPTSDEATLFESIRRQLLTLPDEMKIYPGHGPATSIGRERKSNPYLTD